MSKHLTRFLLLFFVISIPVAALAQGETAPETTTETAVAEDTAVNGGDLANPETVGEILNWITELPVIGQYAVVLFSFLGFLAHLAAFLPKGTKGSLYWKVRKLLIDLLAGNYLNTKNQD